jgi:O-antigen chain-terminating methyltransferase
MPLASASNLRRAVDLGCGRGEFLEVLSSANYNAQGVDLDDGMLAACYDLNLPAAKADALSFTESLPESSQSVVSAFHLVEHIQFEQLQSLVFQAERILEPGGLLILETPNPENLIVSTKNFYLDHTHQRPIPPELLAFIAEFHGFERVKILRLQEPPRLHDASNISLSDIIGGVSPDYAVVAQKKGPDSLMTALNSPFSKDYGITMNVLVARYESLQLDMVRKAAQAEARATQAEARVVNLISSQFWKITAPLRALNDFVYFHKKRGIRFYCKQVFKRFEAIVRR